MKVLLPAQLTKVASRKDRSYSLTFDTRELRGSEASILLDQLQKEGWILYSPNEDIDETDVPKEKADAGMGSKTPSQRLRAVLFVFWEQTGKRGTFEDFYRVQMEKLIEYVKEKLD
jgi:hypothetical protein